MHISLPRGRPASAAADRPGRWLGKCRSARTGTAFLSGATERNALEKGCSGAALLFLWNKTRDKRSCGLNCVRQRQDGLFPEACCRDGGSARLDLCVAYLCASVKSLRSCSVAIRSVGPLGCEVERYRAKPQDSLRSSTSLPKTR